MQQARQHHVPLGEVPDGPAPADRAAWLRPGYSPLRHAAVTLTLAAAIGSGAAWLARGAERVEWLLLPLFWVIANLIEWAVHRFPMHRVLRPRVLYRNHSHYHHRAFTHDRMPFEDPREMGLVMMPWYTMLGLFAATSPITVACALVGGRTLAGIFLLASVTYFLGYELLHALYHMPDAVLARLRLAQSPVFRRLRAHHAHHHRLDRMAHANFNVTVPLADWLLGTRE